MQGRRLSVRRRRLLAATAVALFFVLALKDLGFQTWISIPALKLGSFHIRPLTSSPSELGGRHQEGLVKEKSDAVHGDDLRTSLEKAKHRAPPQIDLLPLSQAQLADHMRYWEHSQSISRKCPHRPHAHTLRIVP